MKQRIFAILLSLTLMFTLVPTAWAENNGITTEAELRTAIENATGEKNTITLAEDIGLASRWTFHLGSGFDSLISGLFGSCRDHPRTSLLYCSGNLSATAKPANLSFTNIPKRSRIFYKHKVSHLLVSLK